MCVVAWWVYNFLVWSGVTCSFDIWCKASVGKGGVQSVKQKLKNGDDWYLVNGLLVLQQHNLHQFSTYNFSHFNWSGSIDWKWTTTAKKLNYKNISQTSISILSKCIKSTKENLLFILPTNILITSIFMLCFCIFQNLCCSKLSYVFMCFFLLFRFFF